MNPLQRFGQALDAWEEFAILTDIEIDVRDSGRMLLDWLENAPAGIEVGFPWGQDHDERIRALEQRGEADDERRAGDDW